jgi:hypothetical protein
MLERLSLSSCAAQEENYTRFEFPGDAHGMMLISPAIEPDPPEMILDFLA